MEATGSSETSVDFQRATQRYTPEVRTFPNYRCDNFISYIKGAFLHRFFFRKIFEMFTDLVRSVDLGLFLYISLPGVTYDVLAGLKGH
jgi:hypothetical protein